MSWKNPPSSIKKTLVVSPTPRPVLGVQKPEEIIKPSIQPKPQLTERANAPPDKRSDEKRIITRNSFQIFEAQMDSLRKLSYHEKMDGKIGSMSAMVREAIDTYLIKRDSEK